MNRAANSLYMQKMLRKLESEGMHWACAPGVVAPATYQDLVQSAEKNLGRIIVNSDPPESSIYLCAEHNTQSRAIHDWLHLTHKLTFKLEHELLVAHHTRKLAEQVGAPQAVCDAMYWDIAGQSHYWYWTKEFVTDQLAFVKDCIARPSETLWLVARGKRY